MDQLRSSAIDWDDLKIALAIVRHGTLSAAARALGTTQPTVSRRLDAFERRIGVQLFERGLQGPVPTALCLALLEGLHAMEEGAMAIERRIAARDSGLAGPIIVTSLDWLGDYVVAPVLARFAAMHPLVDIELVNDGRVFNLARGEADLAIRFGAFAQENLIQKRLAEVSFGFYASDAYLERYGLPDFSSGCAGHLLATLHRDGGTPADVVWQRELASAARVVLRTNGITAQLMAAECGQALAVLPRVMGDARSALRRIDTPTPSPTRSIRLGVHPALRQTARIRALMDFIASELVARASALHPA